MTHMYGTNQSQVKMHVACTTCILECVCMHIFVCSVDTSTRVGTCYTQNHMQCFYFTVVMYRYFVHKKTLYSFKIYKKMLEYEGV